MMTSNVDRMEAAALNRASAKQLTDQLRSCDGGKMAFTNTPNWLRLKAADRIEHLERELAGIRAELAPKPSDEWPTYMAVRAMSMALAAEKALADRLWKAWDNWRNEEEFLDEEDMALCADYRKARGL